MQRDGLDAYLNRFLEIPKFHDYCPNGVQVEGRAAVRRIASGVTGARHRRIAFVLTQDLKVFAYHLPLDAHSGPGMPGLVRGIHPPGTLKMR